MPSLAPPPPAAEPTPPSPPTQPAQAELGDRLERERPRNSLDTRHRLDGDGKRYGKVIEFAVSELRAIELLEGLCNGMEKYQIVPPGIPTGLPERWARSTDAAALATAPKPSTQELKGQRRTLKNACSDIVGRWEDDLAVAIRDGKADAGSVRDVLCAELGGYCSASGSGGGAAAAAGRPTDEL